MPPLTSLAVGVFGRRYASEPPSVVALHGWGRSSVDFDRALAGMAATAIDLPGFGASPAPDRVIGAAGYAERVAPLLEELPTPPVIVGHSFGGRVAVALAADRPELVGGLVLTGVPLLRLTPPRRPPFGYRLARTAHRIGVLPDAWMESLRRRRGSADYRAAEGVMREVLVKAVNESYERELAALAGPVRLVWGADDTEVPPAVAERALELLSGADGHLRVVPGVGHLLPVEAPDVLREEIEAVIGR